MGLWDELQDANWVLGRDNAEWHERAIRAEAQVEILAALIEAALCRDGEHAHQQKGHLHAV